MITKTTFLERVADLHGIEVAQACETHLSGQVTLTEHESCAVLDAVLFTRIANSTPVGAHPLRCNSRSLSSQVVLKARTS